MVFGFFMMVSIRLDLLDKCKGKGVGFGLGLGLRPRDSSIK